MTEIDRYIKEKLKIKYSLRYMDDFVLLVESKQKAKETLKKIKTFLEEKLKLELNSKTSYFKAEQGINFCGFRIWKTHKLIREQSKKKMKRKMKTFQKLYQKDKIELAYITACINSWKGHAKHANTYNLVNKMLDEFILTKLHKGCTKGTVLSVQNEQKGHSLKSKVEISQLKFQTKFNKLL